MVAGQHDRFHPVLTYPTFPLHMHVFGFVAIKTDEEQSVGAVQASPQPLARMSQGLIERNASILARFIPRNAAVTLSEPCRFPVLGLRRILGVQGFDKTEGECGTFFRRKCCYLDLDIIEKIAHILVRLCRLH